MSVGVGNLNPSACEHQAEYYEGNVSTSVLNKDGVDGKHAYTNEGGDWMQ